MKYLVWDIDGTLLLTKRAGMDALKQAIKVRFFKDDYEFSYSLAGRTDSQIVKDIITDIKGRCTSADAASLLINYHKYLKENLVSHQGHLMPNVETTLKYVQSNLPDWENIILSGNTSIGAHAKLEHYKINQYFNFTHGAYGDLSEDRNELARILLNRIKISDATATPDDLIFIGDTAADIKCAHSIGARCILLLAGSEHTAEEMSVYEPWKILDELPANPEDFAKLINN